MANAGTYNHTKQHFAEGAAAATPDAGEVVVYAKTDGKLYLKDDAGTETDLTAGGAADLGDLGDVTVSGSETDGQVLTSDGAGAFAFEDATGGMSNPMTTAEDIIVGGASGAPARLAKGTDDQVLTMVSGAVAWAAGGGGGSSELDTASATTSVTATATTEATADTVISSGSVAYDGSTPVLVEFTAEYLYLNTNSSGKGIYLWLYEDSTSIGLLCYQNNTTTADLYTGPIFARRRITPSNASHTYSIRASKDSGGTTVMQVAAGATAPMQLRIVTA